MNAEIHALRTTSVVCSCDAACAIKTLDASGRLLENWVRTKSIQPFQTLCENVPRIMNSRSVTCRGRSWPHKALVKLRYTLRGITIDVCANPQL